MTAPALLRAGTRTAATNVTIAGIGVVTGPSSSAIELAADAGRVAIDDAGLPDDAIDVLIHVGVYRDQNIVEPAIAALVQKKIGIGLDYGRGDHHLYSFDLMNGACGVLSAIAVAGALLATGAQSVLITASDVHPGGADVGRAAGFPYAPKGAALVLERTRPSGTQRGRTQRGRTQPTRTQQVTGTTGFGPLVTASALCDAAPVGYARIPEVGAAGRRTIVVDPTSAEDLQPLVDDVLARVAPTPAVFAAVPDGVRIIGNDVHRVPGDAHTVGPVLALAAARERDARSVTLVAAGGGPEAAAMNYQLDEPDSP